MLFRSGFYGVVWTDVVQGGLILAAVVYVIVLAMTQVVLPAEFMVSVPDGKGGFEAVRTTLAEWRRFGDPRYGSFRGIGVGAALAGSLAGDALTTPLLLALGAHPAVATAIGMLPFTFSAAQLLVPSLLRRADGNLRLVTLGILALGETRGFVLVVVTLLAAAGAIPHVAAIGLIALVMCVGGAASAIEIGRAHV